MHLVSAVSARSRIVAVLALLGGPVAGAQGELTLAHLTAVPQSLLVNPATPQWSRFSVGASAGAAYHNTAFELGLLELEGEALAEALTAAALGSRAADAVELDGRAGLVEATLQTPVGLFSLGLAQRVAGRVRPGGAALPFAYLGAESVAARPQEDLLAELHVDGGALLELGLGFQQALRRREDITVGGRLKLLRGQAHADAGTLSATAREVDEGGTPRVVELTGEARTAGLADAIDGRAGARSILRSGQGFGAALDAGVHARLDERWSVGASVLDVGFVRWGGGVRRYTLAAEARDWGGVEAVGGAVTDLSDVGAGLRILDEESGGTNAVTDGGSYATALPSRLLLQAAYALDDAPRASTLGGVYRVRLGGGGPRHGAAVSLNWRGLPWLDLSGSYGLDGGSLHLVGAAAAFTLGPVQLFAVSDNALGAADYQRLGTTSVLVGLNVVLGERRTDEAVCPPMGGRRRPRWRR